MNGSKQQGRRWARTRLKRQVAVAMFVLGVGSISMAATRDVADFNVIGDGETLNTAALQRAIDETSAAGGGTLVFRPGKYLTGTLRLRDGITLRIEKDAILLGSTRPADYQNVDPFMAGDGYPLGHALLVAVDAKGIVIEGEGTIDGQGKAIHAAQPVRMREKIRPFLIRWIRCQDVTVRDVTLRNAGAWCVHFFRSSRVAVERVTIRSSGLFNNDGIDVDSSSDVVIRACDVETGDDAICLKTTDVAPTSNVRVSDCKLSTRCNGIKLGTESIGDFKDIDISGCNLRNVGMAGIALYSVDGAHLERVRISDVIMDGVAVPICVRLGSRLKVFRKTKPPTTQRVTGVLRDVTIRNVRASNARLVGLLITGVPGHPVERLTLADIRLDVRGGGTAEDAAIVVPEKESAYPEFNMFGNRLPAYGAFLRHVRGIQRSNVTITTKSPDTRPETKAIDVE